MHPVAHVSKAPAKRPAAEESESSPTPAYSFPNLENTTWTGTNFDGQQYEVTFHAPGHQGQGFTVKTPTHTVEGTGFYFSGQPEHNDRNGITSSTINLAFVNFAELSGEVHAEDDTIMFDDVAPFAIAIDFKALLGDSYKGPLHPIDVGGCNASLFYSFEGGVKGAREALELDMLNYELGNVPAPGPYGLGDASYFVGAPAPDHVPILVFVRMNLYFCFPSAYVWGCTPKQRDRIYQIAYILDSAIRDENPAVTIIRMPKVLQKVEPTPPKSTPTP